MGRSGGTRGTRGRWGPGDGLWVRTSAGRASGTALTTKARRRGGPRRGEWRAVRELVGRTPVFTTEERRAGGLTEGGLAGRGPAGLPWGWMALKGSFRTGAVLSVGTAGWLSSGLPLPSPWTLLLRNLPIQARSTRSIRSPRLPLRVPPVRPSSSSRPAPWASRAARVASTAAVPRNDHPQARPRRRAQGARTRPRCRPSGGRKCKRAIGVARSSRSERS